MRITHAGRMYDVFALANERKNQNDVAMGFISFESVCAPKHYKSKQLAAHNHISCSTCESENTVHSSLRTCLSKPTFAITTTCSADEGTSASFQG